MSNAEKRERQKKIVAAHGPALPDPECLGNISGEDLCLNHDCKNRRHNRTPQHSEQTGATMLNVGRTFSAAAADL